MENKSFSYIAVTFDDIQMLRYRLEGFENLSLQQKLYIYCLAKATIFGRDITFDQFGKYNLKLRKVLELIVEKKIEVDTSNFYAIKLYLRKVWFSSGPYHHYSMDKFQPNFTKDYFLYALEQIPTAMLPLSKEETREELIENLTKLIFDKDYLPKRVNKCQGKDIIKSSSNNFYDGVNQNEVENFYTKLKEKTINKNVSLGLNSTLVKKQDNIITEEVWKLNGKYSKSLEQIVYWLKKAKAYAENKQQVKVIDALITYYKTGDLEKFDDYSIEWLKEKTGHVDFINGFIEVYGDPLGLKGSWEGIVHYKNYEATKRTNIIASNAQWFEDNSPTEKRFKKEKVIGVTASVVIAAMLGGDEYPASAIGINLPNADWIRVAYGSKSVTISNLIHAYNEAAKGNGFLQEFVNDEKIIKLIDDYNSITEDLHTDLHECLGHGSGKLLDTTNPNALKNYGNTIEEARADLFGLYYIADEKLLELGLLDNNCAYKAQYFMYILNGLMTQLVRIKPGKLIEESHMQNRALIARWAYEIGKSDNVIEILREEDEKHELKTYIKINDYKALRNIFAKQLAEIQRIKSEGDLNSARNLVEKYAIKIDSKLHKEILSRYAELNIPPYKGFINPYLYLVKDNNDNIIDVKVDYSETYDEQMERYSLNYSVL